MSLDDAIRTEIAAATAIEDPTGRYTALTDLAVRLRDASDDAVAAATPAVAPAGKPAKRAAKATKKT